MLANNYTRNARLLSNPSDHGARGVPAQDSLARTPLWLTMMKIFPSGNGTRDPKQADGNDSGQLALSPQALIFPPPLLGHNPMVTSLLDQSKVIILPMKDGNGERTLELGPIVTISCHPWDSNAKKKTHQIPPTRLTRSMSALQANPGQPTPGPRTYSVPRRIPPPISPAPTLPPSTPTLDLPPIASSHSYDEACQEFPDLCPTLMIPRAINQILLEHCRLLHMIPFVDATH
ncbi:hypothetical protein O181_081840 [Austropuccinia psidii MF-1]|uniref:Uncharacterized protein n=1 Tax=Austropuccinia psidii MF-1 TaxID=1389203 RepID=A0A9Q3IKA2_9BASI|nr:hypothetical protein [Austropuccinia psidii MF-1]